MVLLLEARTPDLCWCALDADRRRTGQLSAAPGEWSSAGEGAWQAAPECVAYLLPHGGSEFTCSAQLVDAGALPALARVLHFMPDENAIILAAVRHGLAAWPQAGQVLLCDTGFFAGLPPAAAEYAIPLALRQRGVRRYGGFGLAHEWAWTQACASLGAGLGRLVSVFLGNQTNVAAVADGRAVDTSMGFTAVEGIPSATSCGDIDPTIALHLRGAGMTLAEINLLLSRESGFAGLTGRPCSLAELLTATDAAAVAARDVYRASVIKQIGAAIAVLGGVEALTFSAREPDRCVGFVRDLTSALARLEVPWRGWEAGQSQLPPQVRLVPFDRYGVMAAMAAACHR